MGFGEWLERRLEPADEPLPDKADVAQDLQRVVFSLKSGDYGQKTFLFNQPGTKAPAGNP